MLHLRCVRWMFDRVIFVVAAWKETGYFTQEQLMTIRQIDSDLEGHPTTRLPFVDVATGSLGQGLSVVCGMAYCNMFLEQAR